MILIGGLIEYILKIINILFNGRLIIGYLLRIIKGMFIWGLLNCY